MKDLCRDLLFEPWSLGDAIIAAAIAREDEERFVLVCDTRWVSFIRAGLPKDSRLPIIGVHLPYTMRGAQGTFTFLRSLEKLTLPFQIHSVLSIRGDLRDYQASRRLFPNASIRHNGWFGFLARRFRAIDLLVLWGLVPVRNRYEAWADLAGIPFQKLTERYESRNEPSRSGVVIHVGAQWRSRQYPHVSRLLSLFEEHGIKACAVRGPGDALPVDVPDISCREVAGAELAECFRKAELVISNDSGPMHFAAYLGCKTICVASVSNIDIWIAPNVSAVTSPDMPRGYQPLPHYMSDEPISCWPEPSEVLEKAFRLLNGKALDQTVFQPLMVEPVWVPFPAPPLGPIPARPSIPADQGSR